MRRLYTNKPKGGDFTINFFHLHAASAKSAQLACPFFTNAEPVKILRQAGCQSVRLLVRLCEATSAEALKEIRGLLGLEIRFFTDRAFHAKFYILGSVALIGSANLTGAGMTSNREVSLAIKEGDEVFDDLPGVFDELWGVASVLTENALERFTQ